MSRRRSVAAMVRRRNEGQKWRRSLHSTASEDNAHTSLEEYMKFIEAGDHYGDDHNTSKAGSTRVIFQNIQGNSNFAKDDKLRKFSKWLVTEGVGIALTAEMNTYWPTIPKGQRWRDILREASPKGHFSSVAWNSKQPRSSNSACQHGGCAVTLLGQTAHSARTSGVDKTGLGRWAWCRMQGRSRKTRALARDDPETRLPSQDLIVVSAYRPCSAGRGKIQSGLSTETSFSR